MLESRRFVIALTTGILGGVFSMMWSSNSPASSTLTQFYSVKRQWFPASTGGFFLGNGIGLPCTIYVMCHHRIRKLMCWAALAAFLGTLIRMFSFISSPAGFAILVAGNIVGGFGSSVLVGLAILVPMTWFPYNEQMTSSACIFVVGGVLDMLAFTLSAYLITDPSTDTYVLLVNGTMLFFAIVGSILTLVAARNGPKQPASQEADIFWRVKRGVHQTMCHMVTTVSVDFWVLVLQYGIGQSVNWTLQLALEPIFIRDNISRETINNMGVILRLVGFPSIVIILVICNKCNGIKVLPSIVWCTSIFVLVMFTLLTTTDLVGDDTPSALYGMAAATGFTFAGISPVMFPFIMQVAFPVNPSIVVLVSYISAQVFGLILIFVTWSYPPETSFIVLICFMATALLLSFRNCCIKLKRESAGPASDTIRLLARASPSPSSPASSSCS